MRNRKKDNRIFAAVVIIAVLFLAPFVTLKLLYNLYSSKCYNIGQRNNYLEKEYESLRKECNSEYNRWISCKTSEKLNEALIANGLVMKPPRPDQRVVMGASGKPLPGQISIAKFRRNSGATGEYVKNRK
ncbi:MAG: hypothetical protein IJU44_03225 [Kiritimatiellae bacterium]|nr:hypothetical protein [Kiritimatiellia bacterium]